MSLNEEMESYFYSPFVLNIMPVNDASQPLSSMRTQFQATESLNALFIEPSIMPFARNTSSSSRVLNCDKIFPVCSPNCGAACLYSTGVSDNLIGEPIILKIGRAHV